MENIIRNLIVTDTLAYFNTIYHHNLEEYQYIPNGYFIFSPNIIMQSMIKYNIYDYDGPSSINLDIFIHIVEEVITNKKNININLIRKYLLTDTAKISDKEDYDIEYYKDLIDEKIDKKSNNIFLLEIAIVISLFAKTFDSLMKELTSFAASITNNTIKYLSFISIGIFGFYAKTCYLKNKKDLVEPTEWLNQLVDLFIDKKIDQYFNIKLDNNDKKKFIFMLIKYVSTLNKDTDIYAYQRLRDLDDCFCVKIEDTDKHIPGNTADQLFLISFDFFINAKNWLQLFTSTCLTYTELKRINFIASWYYYLNNPDNTMYKKFAVIDAIEEIDEFVDLLKLAFDN